LLYKLISIVLRCLISMIGKTCKMEILQGEQIFSDIVKQKKSVIYSFWHNRIFYMTYFLHRESHTKGLQLSVLISRSKDGDLIAGVVKLLKGNLVRGSSSRGGHSAFLGMLKSSREGYAIAITPDGPKGPKYHFKPGAVDLSSRGQIPILPLSCSFEKAWVFNSWDKFMVPKPFSTVHVRIGNPVQVEPDAGRDKIRKYQDHLNQIMQELGPEFINSSKNS